jgi:hypothetical protein
MINQLLTEHCGFIKDTDWPNIIKENRFQRILVRTGLGRFLCAAQDAQHFIRIIEKEKSDHIRDVSIFVE